MNITSIPAAFIATQCRRLTPEDTLEELVGGQLFGSLHWYLNEENLDDYPYIATNEGGTRADLALMLWLADQAIEPVTLGYLWDGSTQAGIIVLRDGELVQYTLAHEAIHELQKHIFLESGDAPIDEITQLRNDGKSEDEIDTLIFERSEDYYLHVLDELQLEFLNALHLGDNDLAKYPFLKMLIENGHTWASEELEGVISSARTLLQPIDYDDPQSIQAAFTSNGCEFYTGDRYRVKRVLQQMPDQYRDRQDVFEQIIPLIAAWPLELAGISVRSNPDIIRMGVEADKRNGYAPSALKYVDDSVLQNLDFLTEILAMQPTEYYNLPDTLKENRELIKVVVKSGLWVTDDIGSDPELLKLFASSGSRNVYFHIPAAAQNDPNLARLYIENGGEWTALPESLKDNLGLFDCYLSLFPFGTDAAENQMFELTSALKHLFKIESWANCPLDPDLVAHCLSINLGVAGALRYSHLESLDHWQRILNQFDIAPYINDHTMLFSLAWSLRKEEHPHIRALWARATRELEKITPTMNALSDVSDHERALEVAMFLYLKLLLEGKEGVEKFISSMDDE